MRSPRLLPLLPLLLAPAARAQSAPAPAPPRAGAGAPAFSAPDETGAVVSLAALLKEGPVLLAFYPKDFTGG